MSELRYHRTTYECSVCQNRPPNEWCDTCKGTGIVVVTEVGDYDAPYELLKTGLIAVLGVLLLFLIPYVARLVWRLM